MKISTLLIIEDDPKYQKVARNALGSIKGLDVSYAATYEQAMQLMEAKPDAIITDLFFPAKVSTRAKYIRVGKTLGVIPFVWTDMHWDGGGIGAAEYFVSGLADEPSGILVMEYCIENKIPFTVLSQGDRHHGDLSVVRYFIQYLSLQLKFHVKDKKKINACDPSAIKFLMQKKDFHMFLLNSNGVDKNEPNVWKLALAFLKTQ